VQAVPTGGKTQSSLALSSPQHALTHGSGAISQAPWRSVTAQEIAIGFPPFPRVPVANDETHREIRYAGSMTSNLERTVIAAIETDT